MITRFNKFNNRGLSREQMVLDAPSIFAEGRSLETTSDRYTFIPTVEVIDRLQDLNWLPVKAQTQKTRSRNADYAKHLIRFRREEHIADYIEKTKMGGHTRIDTEAYPELILTNAHDGSAAFVFQAGLYRLVCSNGLVIAESTFASMRLTHRGDLGSLRSIVNKVNEQANRSMDVMEKWNAKELKNDEQVALAAAAAVLRWGPDTTRHPIHSYKLNNARRSGDDGASLWKTFNRIQENLLVGGQKDYSKLVNGKYSTRTREVRGIDEQIDLNKGLWMLADRLYQGDTIASMN